MKEDVIYIMTQPMTKNSYWAGLIISGIREAAAVYHDTVMRIDPDDPAHDPSGRHVLVVGNNIDWVGASATGLSRRGAFPMIVNACMLPVGKLRCSGVTFELEEMIERLTSLLAGAGRKHTVLLGVNPNSLADSVKADFFAKSVPTLNPGDIIWSRGSLEECVEEFAAGLSGNFRDAVICSNDTVAISLVKRLTALGYNVPEDICVIGMGNSYVGANMKKRLTSVMFDYHEMGKMSVGLYHDLIRRETPCHMTLSLPCGLIVRDTAPLPDRPVIPETPRAIGDPPTGYFDGDEVQNIIRVETMLQSCDAFDREIIFGISRGKSCDMIAESLFFSGRAIRYRLSRLIREYAFRDRADLESSVRRALGEISSEKET